MSLLSLERVTKRFDGITAVDDVSFAVDRGQVVGFLGPNGAGKSTTMRMITQIFEPDGGEIRLDGVPLAEAGREAKRRIGFLPENNPLYYDMLVGEYLDFMARLRELAGPERARAIDEAVASTGIEPVFNRPIIELSKGYKQRVGLAAAILHRPDLLILDEPTEGLDPNQRVEIRHLIGRLGRERTVMLSTHVLPEVQHTCSRLLIINRGKLVADGSVDALTSRATAGVRVDVEVAGSDVETRLAALPGILGVDAQPAADGRWRVQIHASGESDLRPRIFETAKAEGWTLYELHQESGSLEDLFRQLTAADDAAPAAAPAQEAAA
jgi:gliding motility-associated transport system ATP-binding protein